MIKIICVGKIKENYLKDATAEYLKRLTKYTKLEVIEVSDFSSLGAKEKEAELILKHISKDDYVITLEIEGKQVTSPDLSKIIENQMINSRNIVFIIGGSYGLSDRVKSISNYSLSFSKLTFPHQLFRVILLEQIYRSFKILNNETYHK